MLNNKETSMPLNIQYAPADLKKFVDRMQKQHKDKFATICFFGGEPTLDLAAMQNIITQFNGAKGYDVNFILHTNGLLLGEIPDGILRKINVLFVSLNYERVFADGHITDYFADLVNDITKIKQEQKQITVMGRLTITHETSLYTACTLMGNIFDYVYWQMDNRKRMQNFENYKIRYKKDIALLFDYWLSFLRQGTILYYIPFLGIIRNYVDNEPIPTNCYCGYGDYTIFIQTNGSAFACCESVESSVHKIGDIYNGIEFVDMCIDGTRCAKCQHVKICGGRCGRMHKDFDNARINQFCELNIFTFNLIKEALPELKRLMQTSSAFYKAVNDYHLDYTELIP